MLTVVLQSASEFTQAPLLLIALAAPVVIAITVLLVRFKRKGD